jgi:ABC-type multidrug transport system permease subunit
MENIPQTSFVSEMLRYIMVTSWHSFTLFFNILTHSIETIKSILLHTWYQDTSFNFTAATLTSAEGVVLL